MNLRPIILLSFISLGFPLFAATPQLDTVRVLFPDSKAIAQQYAVLKGTTQRDGIYHSYHPNGQLAHEGIYQAGKLNGPWKSWHPNGKPWKELTYLNDMEEGSSKEWDIAGVLLSDQNYHEGEYEGLQKTFLPDGSPLQEETWKDGKLEGTSRQWDGKILMRELNYHEGRLDGLTRVFWPDGAPKAEMSFASGKWNGKVKQWNEQGQLVMEGEFKDGQRNGIQRRFENGMVIEEQLWENDVCKTNCPVPTAADKKTK